MIAEANPNGLVDMGEKKGDSVVAQQTTAVNHLKKYIKLQQDNGFLEWLPANIAQSQKILKEIGTRGDNLQLQNLLGTYSDYIFKHCARVKQWKPHDCYVSQIHNGICIESGKEHELRTHLSRYFSNLRKEIKSTRRKMAKINNTPFINRTKQPKSTDIAYICDYLLEREMYEELAFINLDKMAGGRVSEVSVKMYFK